MSETCRGYKLVYDFISVICTCWCMLIIMEALHGINNIKCVIHMFSVSRRRRLVRPNCSYPCTKLHDITYECCLLKNLKSNKPNWLLYRQNSQNVTGGGSCEMKLLRLQMLVCLLSGELTWLQYGEREKTICRGWLEYLTQRACSSFFVVRAAVT